MKVTCKALLLLKSSLRNSHTFGENSSSSFWVCSFLNMKSPFSQKTGGANRDLEDRVEGLTKSV